jgi:hypothetical protein
MSSKLSLRHRESPKTPQKLGRLLQSACSGRACLRRSPAGSRSSGVDDDKRRGLLPIGLLRAPRLPRSPVASRASEVDPPPRPAPSWLRAPSRRVMTPLETSLIQTRCRKFTAAPIIPLYRQLAVLSMVCALDRFVVPCT